jgi:hypothetical protein
LRSFLSVIPPLIIFLTKLFFARHFSGHTGSNDTGLEFVSCRGAEKKGGQTNRFIYIDLHKFHRSKKFATAIVYSYSAMLSIAKNVFHQIVAAADVTLRETLFFKQTII